MRDVIYNELMKMYAMNVKADTSTYVADVNHWLAERIEHYLLNGEKIGEVSLPANRRELINMIWMNWPGGGTAEIAADRIIKALHLELPESY